MAKARELQHVETSASSPPHESEPQDPPPSVPETTTRLSPQDGDDEEIDRLAEDLVLHEGNGIITRPIKPIRISASNSSGRKPPSNVNGANGNTISNDSKINGSSRKSLTRRKPNAGKHPAPKQQPPLPKEGDTDSLSLSPSSMRRKSGMEEFLDRVRRNSYLGSPDGVETGGSRGSVGSYDSDLDDTDAEDVRGKYSHGGRDTGNRSKARGTKYSPGGRDTGNRSKDRGNKLQLTNEDMEICRRLDDEYERALEEREIGYNARYASVRQSAFWSVFFLLAYMSQGTFVFMRQTDWSIPESLFFSIFTITTVGYGKEDLPTTPAFQAYTILYIMVGIAALTIMVAQVYQCIALEATRAQHSRDKIAMKQRKLSDSMGSVHSSGSGQNGGRDTNVRTNANGLQRGGRDGRSDDGVGQHEIISNEVTNLPTVVDVFFRWTDRARRFFRDTELGRGISVIFPFAGLILIGAVVVGPIEGWTFVEALYFSVVSLTTVGFGDYVPTELPSIWFCIFWLPFSIGFMSMYLGNVAAFYIRLSDKNIRRIERNLRRRVQKAKEKAELERAEVLRRAYRGQEDEIEAAISARKENNSRRELQHSHSQSTAMLRNPDFDGELSNPRSAGIPIHHAQSVVRRQKSQDGFDMLPTSDLGNGSDNEEELFGGASAAADTGNRRRQRIIENCRASRISQNQGGNLSSLSTGSAANDRTMKNMRDVIRAVRNTMESESGSGSIATSDNSSQFMSIRSSQSMTSHTFLRSVQTRKPSFGLRVLVQERFAEIIAIEVAGYHSSIDIKDYTLSVTIDSMQQTADKWFIPGRARKAFRAVAFEVLYFVGEHGLITRGAEALYDLTPFEFHGLFSSLVAAMGDSDTMEGWLASTDTLALVDLHRSQDENDLPGSDGHGLI